MTLTHFNMVRTGLGIYGLWPSEETRETVLNGRKSVDLQPVLTWKTLVAQIKFVPKGALIGYGCTYQAPHDMKIAILPVGYYDGYRRSLSNTGSVLIRGKRAPVRGRVCMNVIMVEVTDIPGVSVEDEVVLLGEQLGEKITAEELATQMGTITWEVVTQIQESLERKIVD
jgi:alanine racemase